MKRSVKIILAFAAMHALPSLAKQSFSPSEWTVSVSTNEWTGDISYAVYGGRHDVKESYDVIASPVFRFAITNPDVKGGQFFFDPVCSVWFTYMGSKGNALEFDIDTPMARVKFDAGKHHGFAVKYDTDLDSVQFYESEALLRSVMKAKQVNFACYMLNKSTKSPKEISFEIDPVGLPQAIHEAKLAYLKWGSKGKAKKIPKEPAQSKTTPKR